MPFRRIPAFLLALSLGSCATAAQAQTESIAAPAGEAPEPAYHWRLIASPYTYHYNYSVEHKPVYMLGLERQRSDGWLWGGAYFRNSYGQPSGFAYLGQRFVKFSRFDELFVQWSAGLLYGYKKPWEDTVPFNHNGFSPGAALTLGWQFTPRYALQLNALGTAALMFQLSVEMP